MIEQMEVLLRHWAEQKRLCGSVGGLGSPMASIMQYGGPAPRGGLSGASILMAGAGVDYAAQEVDAGLAALGRGAERQVELARLARLRYLGEPAMPVREQMRELGITEGQDRTYRNWVQALHEQLLVELQKRADGFRQVAPPIVRATVRRRECVKPASKCVKVASN